MHIAVAGNIGVGKTTLTGLLAKNFNWEPHYESVDNNPYLDDFYTDMQRWAFNLQVYFLNSRFGQLKEFQESGKKSFKIVQFMKMLIFLRLTFMLWDL